MQPTPFLHRYDAVRFPSACFYLRSALVIFFFFWSCWFVRECFPSMGISGCAVQLSSDWCHTAEGVPSFSLQRLEGHSEGPSIGCLCTSLKIELERILLAKRTKQSRYGAHHKTRKSKCYTTNIYQAGYTVVTRP